MSDGSRRALTNLSAQGLAHPPPRLGQQFGPEPGGLRLPGGGPPRRMGQHQETRQIVAPRRHRRGQRCLAPPAQMKRLGIGPHQQDQAQIGQMLQNRAMPERRAFRPGRRVPAPGQTAGIAQAGGQDRDARFVVEGLAVQIQPQAQPVAGAVVPGD